MSEIPVKIRELIEQNIDTIIPVNKIENNANLFSLGMDSVNSIKLIVAIEAEFNFVFNDEDLNMDQIKTIDNITSYIHSRIGHV